MKQFVGKIIVNELDIFIALFNIFNSRKHEAHEH